MNDGPFDLEAYLERVGLAGPVEPTVEGLAMLQRAHLHAIPFENLDIFLGRTIPVDPAAIFDKLVRRRRGGYCFEQNGLFLMALRARGFDARPLLARVHVTGTPTGRGHQIDLVTIDGERFISDVGFGHPHYADPLPLEHDAPRTVDGRDFRLVDAEPFGTMLQTREGRRWRDVYSFTPGHVCPADIAYGNHYVSTHPDSFFAMYRVAMLKTPAGRISLVDRKLRTVDADGDRQEEVAEGQPYLDVLRERFGIELDAPYEALRPLRDAT